MVTLVNPKKVDNVISAEYYVEANETDKGYLEYDFEKKRLFCVRIVRKMQKPTSNTAQARRLEPLKDW